MTGFGMLERLDWIAKIANIAKIAGIEERMRL